MGPWRLAADRRAGTMILPLPLLLRYRRQIVYVLATLAAAGAVCFMLWRVAAWREGYQQRAAAVKALATAEKALKTCQDATAKANAAVAASNAAYEATEAERKAAQAAVLALLNRPPPNPKTLIVERPTNAPVSSCPDRSPEWRLRYNEIAASAADSHP